MTEEWVIAIHGLIAAHSAIIRDTMRHLVEEGLMEPGKASQIVLQAAQNDLPASESSGQTYDAAREELIAVATALGSWPGTQRVPSSRGPRPDLR